MKLKVGINEKNGLCSYHNRSYSWIWKISTICGLSCLLTSGYPLICSCYHCCLSTYLVMRTYIDEIFLTLIQSGGVNLASRESFWVVYSSISSNPIVRNIRKFVRMFFFHYSTSMELIKENFKILNPAVHKEIFTHKPPDRIKDNVYSSLCFLSYNFFILCLIIGSHQSQTGAKTFFLLSILSLEIYKPPPDPAPPDLFPNLSLLFLYKNYQIIYYSRNTFISFLNICFLLGWFSLIQFDLILPFYYFLNFSAAIVVR